MTGSKVERVGCFCVIILRMVLKEGERFCIVCSYVHFKKYITLYGFGSFWSYAGGVHIFG